jgi:hypothetical protein
MSEEDTQAKRDFLAALDADPHLIPTFGVCFACYFRFYISPGFLNVSATLQQTLNGCNEPERCLQNVPIMALRAMPSSDDSQLQAVSWQARRHFELQQSITEIYGTGRATLMRELGEDVYEIRHFLDEWASGKTNIFRDALERYCRLHNQCTAHFSNFSHWIHHSKINEKTLVNEVVFEFLARNDAVALRATLARTHSWRPAVKAHVLFGDVNDPSVRMRQEEILRTMQYFQMLGDGVPMSDKMTLQFFHPHSPDEETALELKPIIAFNMHDGAKQVLFETVSPVLPLLTPEGYEMHKKGDVEVPPEDRARLAATMRVAKALPHVAKTLEDIARTAWERIEEEGAKIETTAMQVLRDKFGPTPTIGIRSWLHEHKFDV